MTPRRLNIIRAVKPLKFLTGIFRLDLLLDGFGCTHSMFVCQKEQLNVKTYNASVAGRALCLDVRDTA